MWPSSFTFVDFYNAAWRKYSWFKTWKELYARLTGLDVHYSLFNKRARNAVNIHYLPRPCQERGNTGISNIWLLKFKNVLDDGNSGLGPMSSSLEIIYFIIYCFWMRLSTKDSCVFALLLVIAYVQCWWTELVIVWSSNFLQIGSGVVISLRIGSKARGKCWQLVHLPIHESSKKESEIWPC